MQQRITQRKQTRQKQNEEDKTISIWQSSVSVDRYGPYVHGKHAPPASDVPYIHKQRSTKLAALAGKLVESLGTTAM